MQIIPVIDLLGGKVVHGVAGNRADYLPIKSSLTTATDPLGVVQALIDLFSFEIIYVADLDAIQGRELALDVYQALQDAFPNIVFWFDYGLKTKADLSLLTSLKNAKTIIGTETLQDKSVLTESLDGVLSLDYRSGKALGELNLHQQPELWPNDVIVMSLDHVGMDSGPNYALIEQIKTNSKNRAVYAAGGIRDKADLEKLAEKNIKGALVASALHNGKLDKNCLSYFCE